MGGSASRPPRLGPVDPYRDDEGAVCCCCFSSNLSTNQETELDEVAGGFDYTLPLESDIATNSKQPTSSSSKHRKTASINTGAASVFELLYGRYLPFVVRERFLSAHAAGRDLTPRCELECFEAAMSFVDISGFTRLSEELVNLHGTNGAEILNEIISGYFKKLIDVIVDFGGDILKFAGDAMLVMWRNKAQRTTITIDSTSPSPHVANLATSTNSSASSSDTAAASRKNVIAFLGGTDNEPLSALLLRAIACNLTLLKLHNNFQPTPSNTLQLHTGLAAGTVSGIFTGGTDHCWEYFVAGNPIHQMAQACDAAKSGEVVLHADSVHLVKQFCRLRKCATSNSYVITQLLDAPRMFKAVPPPIPSSPLLTEALESFVPRIVKGRMERDWTGSEAGMSVALAEGMQSSLWLAEFRQRVCVMFVALPPLAYRETAEANAPTLAVLQEMVVAVQESVSKWEGSVARLLADDKGTRFKIAFGMPTLAHEDDAIRVVSAAMEIETRIRKIATTHPLASQALATNSQSECSIGIAAGTVYCGEAGSNVRCEYTAVGFIVILAARLMSCSVAGGGGILLDRETLNAVQSGESTITFEARPPVTLKGVSKPMVVYRPHAHGALSSKGAKLLGLADEASRVAGKAKTKQQALQALQQHMKVPNFVANPLEPHKTDSGLSLSPSQPKSVAARKSLTYARSAAAAAATSGAGNGSLDSSLSSSLIGRSREKSFLLSLLDRTSHGDESHVVLIEAEAGLGKSALIYDVLQEVESRGVEFYFGAGDMMEKRTPYFAWRSIFEQLFPGLESLHHPSSRRKHLEQVLSEELLAWGVLLNAIMGTNFTETEFTLQMTTESRAKNLQRLLVAILGETAKEVGSVNHQVHITSLSHGRRRGASSVTQKEESSRRELTVPNSPSLSAVRDGEDVLDTPPSPAPPSPSLSATSSPSLSNAPVQLLPRVIVLEDLHFFDSGSWELLVDVCKLLPNLLLLLTTRPLDTKIIHLSKLVRMRGEVESSSAEITEACFHKLELHELDRNDVLNMAWTKFGGVLTTPKSCEKTSLMAVMEEGDKPQPLSISTNMAAKPITSLSILPNTLSPTVVMPVSLQNLLYETSRGNPLYLEELCRSLIEENVVIPIKATATTPFSIQYKPSDELGNGTGSTVGNSSNPTSSSASFSISKNGKSNALLPVGALSFAKNVLQLMMSRVDRLPPSQQITLKVCAVIGLEIRLDIVLRIHPMQTSSLIKKDPSQPLSSTTNSVASELLRRDLDALVGAGILIMSTSSASEEPNTPLPNAPKDAPSGGSVGLYSFKNAMFREAAYSMLSMQQRVTLHEQCALYYENTYARPVTTTTTTIGIVPITTNGVQLGSIQPTPSGATTSTDQKNTGLEPYYSILNHHWFKAEKWGRALYYTMASGSLALSVNANHEAVKMFELALEIIKKPGSNLKTTPGTMVTTTASQAEQEERLLMIHSNLANALYALGRYTKSISHIETALMLLNLPVHVATKGLPAHDRESVIAISLSSFNPVNTSASIINVGGARASMIATTNGVTPATPIPMPASPTMSPVPPQFPHTYPPPISTTSSLQQLLLSMDDRDSKEIDLKKLLKTLVKSWSMGYPSIAPPPRTLEERETVIMSIRLLEKLCRSSVLSGLMWRAGHSAYLMVTLSESLGDISLLALSCSQCAVSLHELGEGWMQLSESFQARTKQLLSELEIAKTQNRLTHGTTPTASFASGGPVNFIYGGATEKTGTMLSSSLMSQGFLSIRPLDHARLKFQDSLLSAYDGQWNQALSSLVSARSSFARLSENKYWREATFVQGLVFFFMQRWNEAFTAFSGLQESATMDGDRHFEAAGEYWKMVLSFHVDGISTEEEVGRKIDLIQAMSEEEVQPEGGDVSTTERSQSSAPELQRGTSVGVIDLKTVPYRLLHLVHAYAVNSDPTPLLNALPNLVKVIGDPPHLIQNFPLFIQSLSLIATILDRSAQAEKLALGEKKAGKKVGGAQTLGSKTMSSPQLRPALTEMTALPPIPQANGANGVPSSPKLSARDSPSSSSATPVSALLPSAQTKRLLVAFEKLLIKFRAFSSSFKPAFPWYTLYKGRLVWLQGSETKAQKKWKQAADSARKENQVLVVAKAYYLLGSRPTGDSTKELELSRGLLLRSAGLLRKIGIAFHTQQHFEHIHKFHETGEIGDTISKVLGSDMTRVRRDSSLARTVVSEQAKVPLSQSSIGASSALKNPYAPTIRGKNSLTNSQFSQNGRGPLGSNSIDGAGGPGSNESEFNLGTLSRGAAGSHFQFYERRHSGSGSAIPAYRRVTSAPIHGRGSLSLALPTKAASLAGLDGGNNTEDEEEVIGEDGAVTATPAPIAAAKYMRRSSLNRGSVILPSGAPNSNASTTSTTGGFDKANLDHILARRMSETGTSLSVHRPSGLPRDSKYQQRKLASNNSNCSIVVHEGKEEDERDEEETKDEESQAMSHFRPNVRRNSYFNPSLPPLAYVQTPTTPTIPPITPVTPVVPNELHVESSPSSSAMSPSTSVPVQDLEPTPRPSPQSTRSITPDDIEPLMDHDGGDELPALGGERQVPLPRFARRSKSRINSGTHSPKTNGRGLGNEQASYTPPTTELNISTTPSPTPILLDRLNGAGGSTGAPSPLMIHHSSSGRATFVPPSPVMMSYSHVSPIVTRVATSVSSTPSSSPPLTPSRRPNRLHLRVVRSKSITTPAGVSALSAVRIDFRNEGGVNNPYLFRNASFNASVPVTPVTPVSTAPPSQETSLNQPPK